MDRKRRGILHHPRTLKVIGWILRRLFPLLAVCYLALAIAEYITRKHRKK